MFKGNAVFKKNTVFKGSAGGDPNPNSGGAGDDDKNKNVVSYETHQKLLDQRKSDQTILKNLKTELEALKAESEERKKKDAAADEEKQKEQGNYKALVESRDNRIKELEALVNEKDEKVKGLEGKYTNAHKLNAFQNAINGKLKNDKYVNLVDLDKIAIDPETGAVDEKSLKSFATDFINNHKELIEFRGANKTLPNGAAKHGAPLSKEEWRELAKTNPKEAASRIKDVRK